MPFPPSQADSASPPQSRSAPPFALSLPLSLALAIVFGGQEKGGALAATPAGRGEPVVSHLAPSSVARGKRSRLEFSGSRLERPVGVWTSLPAGEIKLVGREVAGGNACVVEVEASADCPLGIYGMRLATESGLSNLLLFAVDELSPRAALDNPHRDFPVAVHGTLRAASVDRYPIRVRAGQRLSFEVLASRFGTDADPLLTIRDAAGRVIVERDNDPGVFFDCGFEHLFTAEGTYTVEVRDSRYLGAAHWQYVLRMGRFPAVRFALPSVVKPGVPTLFTLPESRAEANAAAPSPAAPSPAAPTDLPLSIEIPGRTPRNVRNSQGATVLFHDVRRPGDDAAAWVPLVVSPLSSVVEREPNDGAEQASPAATLPVACQGVLETPRDRDWFALPTTKGTRWSVRAETKSMQGAADVEIAIVDPTGRELQRVDDQTLPGGALDEAALVFNADRDGLYYLVVREATGAYGPDMAYRVTVEPAGPRVQATAELAAFAIPQGNYQSLPFTVQRTDFAGPIEFELVDAPPGVTLTPRELPPGVNSLLCRIAAAPDAPLGIHTIGIVAKLLPSPPPAPAAGSEPPKEAAPNEAPSPREPLAVVDVVAQPLVDKQLINVDLIRSALRDNQRWLPPSVRTRFALQITPPSPFGLDLATLEVVLPRYLQTPLRMELPRVAGFTDTITFRATGGGQFGEEAEGRRQVFYRFPPATAAERDVVGTFHSRSQANDAVERIDIAATGVAEGRSVTLIRSVTLRVQPAYELELAAKTVSLGPGESTVVRISGKRLPGFAGPIAITPASPPPADLTLPAEQVLPADSSQMEFSLKVAPDAKPRRERIRFASTAPVGAFQEEPRPLELEVEIKKP